MMYTSGRGPGASKGTKHAGMAVSFPMNARQQLCCWEKQLTLASCSRTGPMVLHGPHQAAWKSRTSRSSAPASMHVAISCSSQPAFGFSKLLGRGRKASRFAIANNFAHAPGRKRKFSSCTTTGRILSYASCSERLMTGACATSFAIDSKSSRLERLLKRCSEIAELQLQLKPRVSLQHSARGASS